MSPEEQNRIKTLEEQVKQLMRWMEEKKRQQISFPVDETSKKILRDITA